MAVETPGNDGNAGEYAELVDEDEEDEEALLRLALELSMMIKVTLVLTVSNIE